MLCLIYLHSPGALAMPSVEDWINNPLGVVDGIFGKRRSLSAVKASLCPGAILPVVTFG